MRGRASKSYLADFRLEANCLPRINLHLDAPPRFAAALPNSVYGISSLDKSSCIAPASVENSAPQSENKQKKSYV